MAAQSSNCSPSGARVARGRRAPWTPARASRARRPTTTARARPQRAVAAALPSARDALAAADADRHARRDDASAARSAEAAALYAHAAPPGRPLPPRLQVATSMGDAGSDPAGGGAGAGGEP